MSQLSSQKYTSTAEINDVELVKKLQQAQKKILVELDRVCHDLNLAYCLAFGSSLGAIRHQGFIPWDDDIDVYMRIEDLELLQKNSKMFGKDYFLQCHENDPEFGLMITRLRDSSTTLIEENEKDRDINHGIFIDIYPLFNTPQKGWGAKKLVIASMVYRLMLYGVVPKNRGLIMKIGSSILLKTIPRTMRQRLIQCNYRVMKSSSNTGYISSLYGDEANIRYPADWFFPTQKVPFEDIVVPVEAKPDKYLKMTYGDYMELPPPEKRFFHHSYVCVDFDQSFMHYKGIKYCIERDTAE